MIQGSQFPVIAGRQVFPFHNTAIFIINALGSGALADPAAALLHDFIFG